MNRLSLNIRALSIRDRDGLRRWLKEANVAAVVTLDDLTFAADVKRDNPNTISIHRAFGDSEAHFKADPRQLARRYASEGYGRMNVHAYGPNEPAPNDKISWQGIIEWFIAFAEECERVGVRAVLGNLGPGNIERRDIDSGMWDPYLRMLDHYNGWHVIGEHDYTLFPPVTGGAWGLSPDDMLDPARVQPDRWPTPSAITDSTDNWHLMRGRWLRARARKLGLKIPGVILTECFFDRMPDLEQRTPNIYAELERRYGTSGYEQIKGHNTLENVLRHYYPYWDFDTAIYEVLKWCDAAYPPEYIAFCQYMLCTGAPDWDRAYGYDFWNRPKLMQLMKQHRSIGSTPPVATVPKPTTAPTPGRVVKIPLDYVNIREQPVISGRDVGDLRRGATVDFWPDKVHQGWVFVRTNTTEGWVSLQNGGVVIAPTNVTFLTPCAFPYVKTSNFGNRPTPEQNDGDKIEFHDGVDLAPAPGTTAPYRLVAPAGGDISTGWDADGFGNYVVIDHKDGFVSLLGHMSVATIPASKTVQRGQFVGYAGSTGRSTGVHVHWRLTYQGVPIDPLPYMVDAITEPPPEDDDTQPMPPVEEPPLYATWLTEDEARQLAGMFADAAAIFYNVADRMKGQ